MIEPNTSKSFRISLELLQEIRKFSFQGKILVICERNQYSILRSGFIYAAHTIVERIDEETFAIKKHRDGPERQISLNDLDIMINQYVTAIFVIDRETLINVRVAEMKAPYPVRSWYHKKRGTLTGKKFGI